MDDDYFDMKLAWNDAVGNIVPGAMAQVFAITDTSFTTPLEITDLSGIPLNYLVASPNGIYPPFKVVSGDVKVIAKSGSMLTPIASVEGSRGAPGEPGPPGIGLPDPSGLPDGAVPVANGGEWGAQVITGGSGPTGAPAVWPDTFPPSTHTHPVSQVSDASTVGRAVLTAADAQAARAAIGAGTGNGTSNLTLGTTATTAAPGNHAHNASGIAVVPAGNITATNVQDALVQAASSGGGGTGTSEVRVLRYSAGQYPAFPATKPTGVVMFTLIGPVTPTTGNVVGGIPSYVGNGSTQIPAEYRVNAGLS